MAQQTTLHKPVTLEGIGVHSGSEVAMSLLPAQADSGIIIRRLGQHGAQDREISVNVHAVTATEFATVVGDRDGPILSSAEHIMAALHGLEIDNVIIAISGPEAPILDGSAQPIVEAIDSVGIKKLSAPRQYVEILRTVRVTGAFNAAAGKNAMGVLRPYKHGFQMKVDIDFDHPSIKQQTLNIEVAPVTFRRELARARTFGFMRDVAKLWSAGYALGASFENTIVFNEERVLNPGGLRFPDECVRHKALDALGDFRMAGAPILGSFHSVLGGHKLNHAVLSALMADKSAWRLTNKIS
jgi:UDP-3-O-[3-hydroxymyristoyl] N-acetylglucosamine deacetylase